MNLHLDRLTLRVSGLSVEQGRTLARLVSEGLMNAPPFDGGFRPSIRVAVDEQPGESLDSTARRIVDGILRDLGGAS
jgi:hypothetical protein